MSKLPFELSALIATVRPTSSLLKALDAICQENQVSPSAQKPASVTGVSGAGLAGNPPAILDFCDSLPHTMSGDAWEAAAVHVLAMRGQS